MQYGVTNVDLMRMFLLNYNGTTGYYPLLSAVRIRRVDMYDIGGGTDVSLSTVSLAWISLQGPNREIGATGTPLYPGIVSSRPPSKSLAADWISTSTAASIYMVLNAPIGCIVDVTIDFVYNTNALAVPSSIVTVTGTAGYQYTNRLDQAGAGFLKCISMNGA